MKRSILARLTLGVAGFLLLSSASAARLEVSVAGIEVLEGAIMLAMFDSADAFDNGGAPVRSARIPVTNGEIAASFDDLPPGRYAIKLYHDENGNGALDTNPLGLPVEGYGFSGGGGRFGPPAFDDAVFDVEDDADNAIVIRIR